MKQKTPLSAVLLRRTQRYVWVGLFFVFAAVLLATSVLRPVEAATSDTINFQARLLQSSGALVPDGFYNVEFKLYAVASGGSALWTETYYDSNGASAGNDNRTRVANGYLTVNLGSQAAFPGSINWDQELWLTMNVGGTTQTASVTWDGEMDPRLKLTAVPHAFSASELRKTDAEGDTGSLEWGTLTNDRTITLPDASGVVCLQNAAACGFVTGAAADYIQNGTSPQTADFNITGAATVGSLTTDTIDTGAGGGTLTIGDTNADNVTIGDASTSIGVDLSLGAVGVVAGDAGILATDAGVSIQRNGTDSATAFQVQNAATDSIFNVDTTGSGAVSLGETDDAATLFILDTKNTDGDPAGVEGAMYYNSFLGKYRCYKEGAWKNCDGGADAIGTAAPISKVADRGQVAYNSTESSTDVSMADAGSIEIDNYLIARVVWGSASATTMNVTDPRGNTWSVIGPAAVGDTRTYVAYTRVENAYQNNDTITFQPSASGNTRAIVVEEWRNINASDPVVGSEVLETGTGTTPSITRTPTEVGQLFYGHLGVDGGTGDSFTQDADTLEGSWQTLTRVGANQTSNGATKVTEGTSEQTWNPTLGTSRDWGAVGVVFRPALVSEFRHGGNEFGETAVLGTLDNNGLDFITNGATVASLSNTGAATFQNSADSGSAFRIINASDESLMNVDSLNNNVSFGNRDTAPIIQDADSYNLGGNDPDITLNFSPNEGDLLLTLLDCRFSCIDAVPGWTAIEDSSSGSWLGYRISDGTETTIDPTWSDTGSTNAKMAYVFRITNHDPTLAPEATIAENDDVSSITSPALTPSWGSANNLWFALAALGRSDSVSAVNSYPLPDNQHFQQGDQNVVISRSTDVIDTSSLSPGDWVFDGAGDALDAYTVAIAPYTQVDVDLYGSLNLDQNLQVGGTAAITSDVTANATATFQNSTDSDAAFRILNASGDNIINADTLNKKVTFGSSDSAANFSRVQSETTEGSGGTLSPTFDSAPTEGNLLVATALNRDGNSESVYSISGGGWTKRVAHDAELGDTDARRTLVVWTKVAGASEPATVDLTNTGTTKFMIQEFTSNSGGTWTFEDAASNDTGTGSTSPLSTGNTTSVANGNLLLIGVAGWRNDSSEVVSDVAWTNRTLGDAVEDIGSTNGRAINTAYMQHGTGGPKASSVSWTGAGSEGTAAMLVFSTDDTLSLNSVDTDLYGGLSVVGNGYFQNNTDSTAAFSVMNASGSAIFNIDTTNSEVEIGGHILPVTDDTYDLGSSTQRWRDLYLGPNSLHIGTDGDEGVISYNTSTDEFEFDKAASFTTNDSSVDNPGLKVIQQGSGDASMEFSVESLGNGFYAGQDASNSGSFVINSSTAATGLSTPTHVQSDVSPNSGGSSSTTRAQAFSSGVTAGNTIIAAVTWYANNSTDVSCSDNQGNSYEVVHQEVHGNLQAVAICYATNVNSGSTTVTATFGAGVEWRGISISEYSGVMTADPVDGFTGNTGSSASPTTTAVTTNYDGNLVFGAVIATSGTNWSDDDIAANSGFTERTEDDGLSAADLVQNPAGSIAADWTFDASEDYAAALATFRAAPAGSFTDTFNNAIFTLSQTGSLRLQNVLDSSNAFQVQNASGSSIFNIDTTGNGNVSLGEADANATLFTLDSSSSGSDPAGAPDGSMYYNTSMNEFRCRINGSWANCGGTSGGVNFQQGGNDFDATAVLGTTDADELHLMTDNNAVATFGTDGAATFKNSANSPNAFQIQNAAGDSVLNVNTENNTSTFNSSVSINNNSGANAFTINSFEGVTITDDFNRADSNPIGGDWTTITNCSDLEIVSNEVTGTGLGSNCAYWNADSFSNDQYAEVEFVGGSDEGGPIVRGASGAETFYATWTEGGDRYIGKYIDGNDSAIGAPVTSAGTFQTGDTMRLEIVGDTLTLYRNGTPLGSRTDSSIASGSPGIYEWNDNGTQFDNFEAGNVVTGGSGQTTFTVDSSGHITSQGATNSTTAFQIQNAAGTGLLTADTSNMEVTVGDSTDGVILSADGLELRGTARHAKAIVLTPEYAGAVLDGTGTGLMTAGYDSTEKMNYYNWTSSETTSQTYDIVVSVPVPSDWNAWAASSELCVETYSSANTLALADLSVFDTSGTSDFSASDITPSSDDTWESQCFTLTDVSYSADGVMTVIISMDVEDDEFIQVGNITLSYLGKF